jgi:hypothetical protein
MASLTKEPLDQCIGDTSNAPLRRRFTLLPLDRVHEEVWALGFQVHASSGSSLKQARRVWLFRPDRSGESGDTDGPHVAKAELSKREVEPGSRTISNSLMYLTRIDDRDGWDLCRIETIREQSCQSFNEQCSTRQRGQEVLVHIDMWDPETRVFTNFMMTKHRRCGPDFDFSKREAYMLIQHQQRLSLIRSPALR